MGEKTTGERFHERSIMAAIPIVLIGVFFAGCDLPGKKKPEVQARCNEQPQWTTTDERGYPIGIYVCFGAEGHLLYTVRVLPAPKPAVVAQPAPAPVPSAPEAAVKKPTAKPAPLPTLGGTATEPKK